MNRLTFDQEVQSVVDALPAWVREQLDNVVVIVESNPSPAQDPAGAVLLGLYEGVALPDRGVDYFGVGPDTISIFFQPHVDLGLPDDQLRVEIRRTVLHEVGHALGLDEQRLHELGWA